jgi:hypothetical protein
MKTADAKKNAPLVLTKETVRTPRVKTMIRVGKRASAQGPEIEVEPELVV